MYRNFKSQLGYENGENKIDSYGVDHSNFSLRDEVSYQMARTNRENELIKNYNNQGITQDYPQYNTNFWGNNPANNYGFGSSNISDNIENVTNSLKNQNYGFDTNTNNLKPNNVYNTVGSNGTFSTANIQTPPQTSSQLQANSLNKANSMELFNNQPSLQMDLRPKPLNESNSYTTESAWGFPNTKSANVEQNLANNLSNTAYIPYIFSQKMRLLLGQKESENNYKRINSEGGGFGAIGKYQIRRDGFKDTGYIDNKNQWTGKNNIYSIIDFLNNQDAQEKFLDEYFQVKYRQLQSNGSLKYLGYPFKGVINNFDITDTGLLAASHREGAGAVHNFLSHLEKDANGRYYLDYDKIQNLKQRDTFKHIETRLREFEK